MLHYFKKPHDLQMSQRSCLNQIPKRARGQLRALQEEAELGWGLHFEEGWHWMTIGLLMTVLVIVPAIVFGVVWSCLKQDIQGAFSISAVWIAVGSLLLAYVAWRDI